MYTGNKSRNIKARCDEIGMTVRVLFWISLIYSLINLGFFIFVSLKPAQEFSVSLVNTVTGPIGMASYEGGKAIQFAANVLNGSAQQYPKLVYAIGFFTQCMMNFMAVGMLWNIRNIFRNIDRRETPFLRENSKGMRFIGILVIIAVHIKTAFMPLLCAVLGVGAGGSEGMLNVPGLLAGGVIIGLSYIFDYGTVLQMEADETI